MRSANLSEKKFFTTGQIAKICGVSIATVQKWIDAGEINSYRLPLTASERRVPRESLLSFMKKYNLPTDEVEAREPYRVLIAEKKPQLRSLVEGIWAGLNHSAEVMSVSDGTEVLVRIGSFKPHLILLDLNVPGIDVIKTIEFLRQSDEWKDTKIIVLSEPDKDQKERLKKLGVDAMVSKSAKSDKLKELIIKTAGVA